MCFLHSNQMGLFHYHRVFLEIYRTNLSQFQGLARLLKYPPPSLVSPRGEVRALNVVRIFIVSYLIPTFTTLCSLTLNDLTLANKLLRKKLRMFKKLAVFTFENINILKEIIIFQEILSFVAKAPIFNEVLRSGN